MDYGFTKEELDILDKKCYPHDRHFLPKEESEELCTTNSTTTESSVCTGVLDATRIRMVP